MEAKHKFRDGHFIKMIGGKPTLNSVTYEEFCKKEKLPRDRYSRQVYNEASANSKLLINVIQFILDGNLEDSKHLLDELCFKSKKYL